MKQWEADWAWKPWLQQHVINLLPLTKAATFHFLRKFTTIDRCPVYRFFCSLKQNIVLRTVRIGPSFRSSLNASVSVSPRAWNDSISALGLHSLDLSLASARLTNASVSGLQTSVLVWDSRTSLGISHGRMMNLMHTVLFPDNIYCDSWLTTHD